jgi:lipase maturation factor 1
VEERLNAALKWVLGPEVASEQRPGHLWARWIVLRALGLIYFSAFYSLLFQIKGLMGPDGILPAGDYLKAVAAAIHGTRLWFAPTLLWLGSSDHALMALCWVGLAASLLVALNLWPRASLAVCFVCFLSFVSAAQDFSGYQSDGMLLEAGFIAQFFAPGGLRPGLGRGRAASRLSRFLLQWEWFRIYFESGVAKLASGDRSWRDFTAMDNYYQNCPLPTWIGWYVAQLPHWFHAFSVFFTFACELGVVWLLFAPEIVSAGTKLLPYLAGISWVKALPRRLRIACFLIVTPFQISIILTANYTFLNYIVLVLGFLLLDDRLFERWLPELLRKSMEHVGRGPEANGARESRREKWRQLLAPGGMILTAFFLGWIFYATTAQMIWMMSPMAELPVGPVRLLEPFRIANRYGLFAVMTPARYEIEFQGSRDGKVWTAYPFRYKPQDPSKAPGIYAPYQPRFEWNLWFASLGSWREFHFVVWTEERLLRNEPEVMELFAANPFQGAPPQQVRAVIYQYWFTDLKTKRETGRWWKRELLGDYAPGLEREPDGKIGVLDFPIAQQPEE